MQLKLFCLSIYQQLSDLSFNAQFFLGSHILGC